MAHFDTEYQRLEASYNDSPPGEENLMVHVAEGSKCKYRWTVILSVRNSSGMHGEKENGILPRVGGETAFLVQYDPNFH